MSFTAGIPIALQGVASATLQIWLSQAQQALQDIITGGKPVTVGYANGSGTRSVTYHRTDVPSLRAWIQELLTAINPGQPALRRRPLFPRF